MKAQKLPEKTPRPHITIELQPAPRKCAKCGTRISPETGPGVTGIMGLIPGVKGLCCTACLAEAVIKNMEEQ